jgi:hypothetical protein
MSIGRFYLRDNTNSAIPSPKASAGPSAVPTPPLLPSDRIVAASPSVYQCQAAVDDSHDNKEDSNDNKEDSPDHVCPSPCDACSTLQEID